MIGIFDAANRMFHAPNRGRLGSWRYYIAPDGTITIKDAFSATEETAAREANDSKAYNTAKGMWFRDTTHELEGEISPEQQKEWLDAATMITTPDN